MILNEPVSDSWAIRHQDSKCENMSYSLIIDRDKLRDERDQLKIQSRNLTEEMELLQSQYNAMAASRDKLQEEVNRLKLSKTGKKCTHARHFNGFLDSLLWTGKLILDSENGLGWITGCSCTPLSTRH